MLLALLRAICPRRRRTPASADAAVTESGLVLSPKAAAHLRPILAKFEPAADAAWSWTTSVHVDLERVPVPWLAYLALTQIVGSRDVGRHEKVRWQVPFTYDGVDAMLADQKFGLRLYLDVPDGRDSTKVANEIAGKLIAIIRTLERDVLADLSQARYDEGRVTIVNQAHRLRDAYEHFRSEAEQQLAASEADDTFEMGEPGDGEGGLLKGWVMQMTRLSTGSHNGIAATTSYFSWLEHVLVLMLAFTDIDPSDGTLRRHIGDSWQDKFRRVFDMKDKESGRILGRLQEVAEQYRNTYAHGGFDKQGGTIGVHIDGIGPVPARLTDVRRAPQFEIYPFSPSTFGDLTTILDEVDAFLRDGPRRLAMQYVESGLHVAYDNESRREYRDAMSSASKFSEYVAHQNELVDAYLNYE